MATREGACAPQTKMTQNKRADMGADSLYASLMKRWLILLVSITALAAVSGCSNKNIDTAKVREALQSLSGDAKQNLEQGLKAIDEGNFAAAARPLKVIAYKVKLDKHQREVLEDTIAKVEAKAVKK
jgi:hypothetical protein